MHTREAMIPLTTFVQSHKDSQADAESLAQTFLSGSVPTAQYFPRATKHVAKNYLERESEASFTGALATYLEYALMRAFPWGFPNWQYDKNEKRQMLEVLMRLYGTIPTDKASNAKILLFSRAAFYDFSKIGSCSYRASYAALQLFRILQGTSLAVALQSAPSVDHFTVLIGNKKVGYYVYDALTNPLMVFDREFYIKNILSTFPKALHQAVAMNMTITKELLDGYDNHLAIIKDEFKKLLSSSERNPKVLLRDPDFIYSLKCNIIQSDEMQSQIEKATQIAITMAEKSALSLKK